MPLYAFVRLLFCLLLCECRFGADDHSWAPKVPLFGSATAVHRSYDDGNCSSRLACRKELGLPGSMMDFSWNSAFWVNSAVAKMVYSEYDRAAPVVRAARANYEAWAAPKVAAAEKAAKPHFAAGDEKAGIAVLTKMTVEASQEATARWTTLWQVLMVTYADGETAVKDDTNLFCGCKKSHPTYSDAWTSKVVADTGDRYRLPDSSCVYIDPDGHCHSKPPNAAANSSDNSDILQGRRQEWAPVPKTEVPGVLS